MIEWIKKHENAIQPTKGSQHAAGYDLYATEDIVIERYTKVVLTGVGVIVPQGYYGQIFGRSGLGSRGVVVGAGVIDADYRGEIGVVMTLVGVGHCNLDPESRLIKDFVQATELHIPRGRAIAQIVFLPYLQEPLSLETDRGDKGWGSSDSKV